MLFDTHTHFNASDFDDDREAAIQGARNAGVSGMNIIGFDKDTIPGARELVKNNKDMVASYGWHPEVAGDYNDAIEQQLQEYLDTEKVVAVGEFGLDYHWNAAPKDVQERVMRRQIAIARERHLPIIIHTRDANEDTYRILKDEHVETIGGIMHTFGDDPEWAKKFLDLNMHISFSGVLTFKKSKAVREAAKIIPEDRLLIETDSPYLSPEPHRGQRNTSANVRFVCNLLADVRDTSYEAIAAQTYQNACDLFHIRYDEEKGFVRTHD
ncbi:MAG: TatD family hydrolase [Aerococcus sp.]|nr:TatD family hydrolase [Aerococcus sp.]